MELEEAIEILNNMRSWDCREPDSKCVEAIETILNHITKQEKMINLMVEHIETGCDFDNRITNKVQIKKYFEKKAEEVE